METSDKNRDNELELVRGIYEELSIIIIIMSWFLLVLIELIHGILFFFVSHSINNCSCMESY